MKRAIFEVTLELEGPLVTCSTATGALGLDLVMARTADVAHGNVPRFYLPGTLLKGLVREAWQQFGETSETIKGWLGNESSKPGKGDEEGPNEPDRGRLNFGDAFDRSTDANQVFPLRYRTRIDRDRGSVDEGALLMIESPYSAGQPYKFTGRITALLADSEKTTELERSLRAAFLWIPAAGAEKTVGFGRILSATVTANEPAIQPVKIAGSRFDLQLAFDRPICFGKPRLHPNFFEATDTVPGAAIKAALAKTMHCEPEKWKTLHKYLHSVVISDCFPARHDGSRPERFPYSLIRFEDPARKHQLRDAIDCAVAPRGVTRELRFSVDWKLPEFVVPGYEWPDLEREVRVRTAIDGDNRRARDENLFAYEMVVPARRWCGSIDLVNVAGDERQVCSDELQHLLALGLEGLGKTKACASINLSASPSPSISPFAPDLPFALTLQTPALLLDPSKLAAEPLLAAYQSAWHDISGGRLRLRHFFHRTRLYGGEYLYRRFQQQSGDGQYRPYLLSEAGSVFSFEPGDVRDLLEKWQRTHLPMPAATRHFYQLPDQPTLNDWEHCPCLPENGFGEFGVNLHLRHQSELHLLSEADYV